LEEKSYPENGAYRVNKQWRDSQDYRRECPEGCILTIQEDTRREVEEISGGPDLPDGVKHKPEGMPG
jgi:hypothetical protein